MTFWQLLGVGVWTLSAKSLLSLCAFAWSLLKVLFFQFCSGDVLGLLQFLLCFTLFLPLSEILLCHSYLFFVICQFVTESLHLLYFCVSLHDFSSNVNDKHVTHKKLWKKTFKKLSPSYFKIANIVILLPISYAFFILHMQFDILTLNSLLFNLICNTYKIQTKH